MISKKEWETAARNLIAGGRQVGPLPTFEEVVALSRGELSEESAERVRELLSYYPDLLLVLTQPFPANTDGVLTDDELATDLAKIREQVRHASTSPLEPVVFPQRGSSQRALAIAASFLIAVALASLAVWQTTTEPRAVSTKVIYPDGARGGRRGAPAETPAQLSTATDYTLQLASSSSRRYRDYRIELLDLGATPPRRLWIRKDVPRQPDGTYPVRFPTGDLEPGLYRLVLYGVRVSNEPIAEYTLRLSQP